MNREDRAVGALLGLACGDALGRPLDGLSGAAIADRYGRVTEMRSDGDPAGTTTGPTAGALAAARALLDQGVEEADPGESGRRDGHVARDGALPRGVPLAVAYAGTDRLAPAVSAAARTVHPDPDPAVVESSVALARVVGGLVTGDDATTALDDALALAVRRDAPAAVRTALAVATDGTAAVDGRDAVGTLEAALHDALTADGPEAAVVAAVNRGGPAATAGAVTGAVAGARFGAAALPDRWLDHLATDEIRRLAAALDRASVA